ncbi:MAG: multicopper oxidase domain-containing protein [Vulcanimicrobiaceae bacterium]|jgi:hephaestin
MTRVLFCVALSALLATSIAFAQSPAPGVTRTYYIAADEIDWNYMPAGHDMMMGMGPSRYGPFFAQHKPGYVGRIYRKAVYREYTDGTFAHLKPRSKEDAYLGILGPTIYAEVGDRIKVVFRNHGTHPYSVHAHGVLYEKPSEGSTYADGTMTMSQMGGAVPPGKAFTYVWNVPERAGPGPNDPSSIVWLYHSHADERSDVNAGLIGAMVITRAGMARPDGKPKDVDRNFVTLFMTFDENASQLLDSNIKRFVKKTPKWSKLQNSPLDPAGNFDPFIGGGFVTANFRSTINGYQFANMPMPTMHKGEHVRWYLLSLGEGLNFHTPHWHGNTVLVGGQRSDVVLLGPASMVTADMIPDNPGIWLFHCHVSEHMEAGMAADYRVLP